MTHKLITINCRPSRTVTHDPYTCPHDEARVLPVPARPRPWSRVPLLPQVPALLPAPAIQWTARTVQPLARILVTTNYKHPVLGQ